MVDHSAAQLQCFDYGELLRASLMDALAQAGIESQGTMVGPTWLSDSQWATLQNYHPDRVLFVEVAEAKPFYYNLLGGKCGDGLAGYDPLSYWVALFDSQLAKSVWHADASNSGGFGHMEARLRKMALAIVRQLKADGVLSEKAVQ